MPARSTSPSGDRRVRRARVPAFVLAGGLALVGVLVAKDALQLAGVAVASVWIGGVLVFFHRRRTR